MNRRRFIRSAVGATLAMRAGAGRLLAQGGKPAAGALAKAAFKLQPMELKGVRLLDGPFAERLVGARDYLFEFPEDDLLKGFREAAGLPAPGQHMGGWCEHDSGVIFGQWLSAMARLACATSDTPLLEKAVRLMDGWSKTWDRIHYDHYRLEKFACGLVDLAKYGEVPGAVPLLEKLTDWGSKNLGRVRRNATQQDWSGGYDIGQIEWYTLPENFYRAYLLTGDERYRDFADLWRYPHYWGHFNGQTPGTPDGLHAYSHCNTLTSAAMAYAVTGDASYLQTITNGADYFLNTQCFATGGFGPSEGLVPPDGTLGRSLELPELNDAFLSANKGRTFETPCGTWAVFKLTRLLQAFTGAARWGDWTERVLYNGIGAALPVRGRGESFYYADYRLLGARKVYYKAAFPCCSGTYFQDMAGLLDAIYFTSPEGLYVNLFVPSEVGWMQDGHKVTLTQRHGYPESESVSMTLSIEQPRKFVLALRVPEWAHGASVRINDVPVEDTPAKGTWMELRRIWSPRDRVELRLPMTARAVPVDKQHPKRVAYARGAVVLVRPDVVAADKAKGDPAAGMVPFYQMKQEQGYGMYFDT